MQLYHTTLQKPSAITCATLGAFSGTKQQEMAVCRGGNVIELMRIDTSVGKAHHVHTVEAFACVRSMTTFRLLGSNKDYLVVGSDSGRLCILEYKPDTKQFIRLQQESFGKTGVRRIVPGQYLAVDPRGRALMIGAIERQKFVYVLNREPTSQRLVISSPLEAHRQHTVTLDLVGIDVGYDNPLFAALECDISEPDSTEHLSPHLHLTYYELDLGLNHVVRKLSDEVDSTAHKLIALPGGADGPSGVLLCSQGRITYRHQHHPALHLTLPQEDTLVVAACLYKSKSTFFVLVQTEQGDLFKLDVLYTQDRVSALQLLYLDQLPTARHLQLLRNGILFTASDSHQAALYQLQRLDGPLASHSDQGPVLFARRDDFAPDTPPVLLLTETLSAVFPVLAAHCFTRQQQQQDPNTALALLRLSGHSQPHLALDDASHAVTPTLSVSRHGYQPTELAVSPLPATPTHLFTLKRQPTDAHHALIVISFVNATLVLAIGEMVEEVTDSGLLADTQTLYAAGFGHGGLCQVTRSHVRWVTPDNTIHAYSSDKDIVAAHSYDQVLVVITAGGELLLFEPSPQQSWTPVRRKLLSTQPMCVCLAAPAAHQRSSEWLALGCVDGTVRILLVSDLSSVSLQAVGSVPHSVALVNSSSSSSSDDEVAAATSSSLLLLYTGLQNGVVSVSRVSLTTGQLSETRSRFMGAVHPVHVTALSTVASHGYTLLAASQQSHLFAANEAVPLLYSAALSQCAPFSSEQCPWGVAGLSQDALVILSFEQDARQRFATDTLSLSLIPRKWVPVSDDSTLSLIIERQSAVMVIKEQNENNNKEEEHKSPSLSFGMQRVRVVENVPQLKIMQREGSAVSLLRIVDHRALKTRALYRLAEEESLLSVAVCPFHMEPPPSENGTASPTSKGGDDAEKDAHTWPHVGFVLLATASGYREDASCTRAAIHTLSLRQRGEEEVALVPVHSTRLSSDEAPLAVLPLGSDRVVVAQGASLAVYEMGRRKLLKKCEVRGVVAQRIVRMAVMGWRICVADLRDGVSLLRYLPRENQLVLVAEDALPRWTTCLCFIDYCSVAVGDKFGNVSLLRLDKTLSEELDEDPTGVLLQHAISTGKNSFEWPSIMEFHVGDTVMALQKATLSQVEVMVYTTLLGRTGLLAPVTSRLDAEFLQQLEMHVRNEQTSVCGRDHLSYRSSFRPVKAVVDGDLCAHYRLLASDKMESIAQALDGKEPTEVLRKLEDFQVKYAAL